MAHVAVELDERAGVAEPLGTLACEQLPRGVVLLDGTAGARVGHRRSARQAARASPRSSRAAATGPIVSDVDPWTAIDRSTIWPYEDGHPLEFSYVREGHPGQGSRGALGALDGGHRCFPGVGAGCGGGRAPRPAPPGTTVALAADAYYGVGLLIRISAVGPLVGRLRPEGTAEGADLVWLEAPSNPFLTFPDLGGNTAGRTRARRCDGGHAGPLAASRARGRLRPPQREFLGGHHDLLLGVLVCRREEDLRSLLEFRTRTGAIATPDAAALLLAASDTARESSASRRRRSTSRALRSIHQWSSSAIPASSPTPWPRATWTAGTAHSSRSTSPVTRWPSECSVFAHCERDEPRWRPLDIIAAPPGRRACPYLPQRGLSVGLEDLDWPVRGSPSRARREPG